MRNKCKSSIKAGIAAMAASFLVGLPAVAGNMVNEFGIAPDGDAPKELRRDGGFGADAKSAQPDADFAAILGRVRSARYDFFGTVGDATNSINSEHFDIRDVALLGEIGGGADLDPIELLGPVSDGALAYGNIGSSQFAENFDSVPNLSQNDSDRPAVIKWIYSLLEAVGINERCSDPNGCGSRVAVKK